MTALSICAHCHQPLPPPVYKVGRLRMDTGARRVYELNRRFKHGEREIKLEPQEYELLSVLMRRPGMAFTCDILAEQLMTRSEDPAHLISGNIVPNLKKKVPEGAAHIETVRGTRAGRCSYRIVP